MKTVATEIRVRYGDTDQMGVVYYANYLRYFEVARAEWLRAQGRTYRDMEARGHLLPVVEARVRYLQPARYDDLLAVEATPGEVRLASLRFDYRVRRGEETLAEGWTTHACVGREGRPVRLPAEIVALLRQE
jgi:acyl-CoA thioester hydrolase